MTQSKIQSHLMFNEKVALKRKKLYEATMHVDYHIRNF